MEVRIELRNKRNEIFDRLIEIRKAQADLEAQIGALDQVIAIYEPNYVPARALIGHKARNKRQKAPETIEIDVLLGSIEPTNAVLEILREAAAPLSTAECAVRLMQKLGIGGGDPRTGRVATSTIVPDWSQSGSGRPPTRGSRLQNSRRS
jgi:hypothetical protein